MKIKQNSPFRKENQPTDTEHTKFLPPILKLLQDRGCDDSCCARHISFLEEERRSLAIEYDKLRVERDALRRIIFALRQQLRERQVA